MGRRRWSLLSLGDLLEVLASGHRRTLFLGAFSVPPAERVLLVRGNLRPLWVPYALFPSLPAGPHPDFGDLEVTDGGQTLRLGRYEAAADAVLCEAAKR
jgi:hypothetical protein